MCFIFQKYSCKIAEKGGNIIKKVITFTISICCIFATFAQLVKNTSSITPSSPDCTDYLFLFARGSGQPLKSSDYASFLDAVKKYLPSTKKSYNVLELSELPYTKSHYPAVSVSSLSSASSVLFSKGQSQKYKDSIILGAQEISEFTHAFSKKCPNTKYILAGYSQGAQVVMTSLPMLNPEDIFYVATFGDPNLFLPEGKGFFPPACRGEGLSSYRTYAPDCRTYEGILSARIPYHPSIYLNKIGIWCNKEDAFCSKKLNPIHPIRSHLSYSSERRYHHAVSLIHNRIISEINKSSSGKSIPSNTFTSAYKHNIAFLIDSTGSMSGHIKFYKNEATKLAEKVIANHGKIALYEYKDLKHDTFGARQLTPFTENIDEFSSKLSGIVTRGGGASAPESALHAIKSALNELDWQYGSTKSIILLTDAGFHSPDHDGTTVSEVVKRSLEIDPVNIYVVSSPSNKAHYEDLIQKTNGKFFPLSEQGIADSVYQVFGRPSVSFPLEEYLSAPGDIVTFDISNHLVSHRKIVQYEWDLDSDGVFEHKTIIPVAKKIYHTPTDGYVQVRVTDNYGLSSTGSAHVVVKNPTPLAKLSQLSKSIEKSTVKISYKFQNASHVLFSADSSSIGVTDRPSITITYTDAPPDKVYLTAISSSGEKGQSYTVHVGGSNASSGNVNSLKQSFSPSASILTPNLSSGLPSASTLKSTSRSDLNELNSARTIKPKLSPVIPYAPDTGVSIFHDF